MKHIGLFEGIGGFSIAAREMGWETVAWCEKDPFCQKVLSYHFKNADRLGDIYNEDFKKYRGKCDILTGGFPCQPFSLAGSRAGTNDDRFLWGEMLRAIAEVSPTWVVAENVRGLLSIEQGTVFETVCSDLENAGYEVLPFIIPAASVNAPHKRERVWIIAYRTNSGAKGMRERTEQILENRISTHANGNRQGNGKDKQKQFEERQGAANTCISGKEGFTTYTPITRRKEREQGNGWENKKENRTGVEFRAERLSFNEITTNATSQRQREEGYRLGKTRFFNQTSAEYDWENFPTQSPICGRDDGIPSGLDGITFPKWRRESIKAYGNAIVPQVAIQIFKTINNLTI